VVFVYDVLLYIKIESISVIVLRYGIIFAFSQNDYY
jgi:hypothetical protein